MEERCFVSGSAEGGVEPGGPVCMELELGDEGLWDEEGEDGGSYASPARRKQSLTARGGTQENARSLGLYHFHHCSPE